MFNYYFGLAVRNLKRNIVLTVLMIDAVGVGIGASMTTLTVSTGKGALGTVHRRLEGAADVHPKLDAASVRRMV